MTLESIRRRLLLWNVLIMSLVVALVVCAALVIQVRDANQALEQNLQNSAERVGARMLHHYYEGDKNEPDEVIGAEPTDLLQIAKLVDEEMIYSNYKPLPTGFPDYEQIARVQIDRSETKIEKNAGDVEWRLLTVAVVVDENVIGYVQVAGKTSVVHDTFLRSSITLGITGLFGLLAAFPLAVFLVSRAMKPVEDSMVRQQKFIADASHELRTPVAVIRARAENLVQSFESTPPEITKLLNDTVQLSELLKDLLDFARLDSNQLVVKTEPVPLIDVVEELVEQLQSLARENHISIKLNALPLFAMGDLPRVRQIVRALIDNALTHATSVIVVNIAEEGENVCVAVGDDGDGVSQADLPYLFDRFYRADSARSRVSGSKGAGLGLAISAELAKCMNGRIDVGHWEGGGACFRLYLPKAT